MASKKKILITTTSHEILFARRLRNSLIERFCPECQEKVEMMTLDEATSKTGISTRETFRLIEDHQVHSIETTSGHLLICLNSLEKTQ